MATPIGLIIAFAAILMAIILEGANPTSVLLPAPMILVFVTTFGVALAGSNMSDMTHAFKTVPKIFKKRKSDLGELIDSIVELASTARSQGLLALEDSSKQIDNEFLKVGLRAAIDGTDSEALSETLDDLISAKRKDDRVASKFFEDMGGYAPTIGIVGTVVSLVHVLENLSDPAELGHMIAAAFVATLWGIASANVLWLPISNKIKRYSALEIEEMEIIVEGVICIQSGANPRTISERLRGLIPATSGSVVGGIQE